MWLLGVAARTSVPVSRGSSVPGQLGPCDAAPPPHWTRRAAPARKFKASKPGKKGLVKWPRTLELYMVRACRAAGGVETCALAAAVAATMAPGVHDRWA